MFENLSDELPYESDVLIDQVQEKDDIDVIKQKLLWKNQLKKV